MSTSMILLVALQAFWLRNSYEKAYDNFRGQSSRWLREAVLAVRDSALLKNIQAIPPDSSRILVSQQLDTFTLRSKGHSIPPRREGQVQVFVSSDAPPDSTRLLLRSIASQYSEGKFKENSRFTIRIGNDSLNLDSVKSTFARGLRRNGKDLPFEIRRVTGLPPFPRMNHGGSSINRIWIGDRSEQEDHRRSFLGNELRTEWVRVDPVSRYSAVITRIRPLLLKEIAPQILFGCFLTVITFLSFAVMYRSIRSQQRLMALKSDFISNITHELKTPIATVSVALEALKNFRGIDNPKLTAEYLDIAQLELTRLSMLTEKVLTTSLFDENGVSFDLAPVDLEEAIAAVMSSQKLVWEKANATVTLQKEGSDFTVHGSALHLTNVVHNLLDNALKYSPSKPEIAVTIKDMGSRVELSVSDKGMGIPAEYQDKIFERFFRMPTGDVHNIKGYGLGLSYVDQVVRKHGGTITVMSVPGQGSTFTIILPKQAS